MNAVATYPGLSGQHVFITGAARGLGRSMAEKLARCGATVAVTDVDAAAARRLSPAFAPQAALHLRTRSMWRCASRC